MLNNETIFEPENVNRTDYVKKREIDHSTLYSFNAPFQLLHADIGNLEFLGKNATFPQYVLVIVYLFSSKVYTYPMKSRKQIRQKLEQFYRDVKSKRKGKKMRLQVDREFQQVKIKDLNELNNVTIFSTSLTGGKAFAAEQKIRELRTRIAKLKSQKLKIPPKKIIEISTANMNIRPRAKYGFSPEEVEKRALESERFKVLYNMHRLEKTNQVKDKIDIIKKILEKTKKVERNFKHWRKSVYFSRKSKEKDYTWKILLAVSSKHKLF